MTQLFANQLYTHILDTVIVVVVILLLFIIFYSLFKRKYQTIKLKKRFKARLLYLFLGIGLVFIVKIWVVGFTALFYGLSLVSAALVMSNKETIMNLVGWFIINWRGLFSEGDYIELQSYKGIVFELNLFYFKVLIANDIDPGKTSGQMLKVPNGLIITNVITNYSLTNNFITYEQRWLVPLSINITLCKKSIIACVNTILQTYYAGRYNLNKVKQKNTLLSQVLDLNVGIKTALKFDAPQGLWIILEYYCFPCDHYLLDEQIREAILTLIEKNQWLINP